MKIKSTAAAVMLLLLILSCNRNSSKEEFATLNREIKTVSANENANYYNPEGNGFNADSTKRPEPPQKNNDEKKKGPEQKQPAPNPDWDKKIIKTASLNLEIKDYNAFYTATREKIRNVGGYVAQEEQQQTEYKLENTIVIKVPVDQFDNALTQISSGVEKVNERKITSQDVTAEYVDTKSRIEAKKQVRERYMDFLRQAKNMEEILNVQSEINGIQEEIESATGRVEYLGHSAAYSTINLTFYQVLDASAKTDIDKSPSFGTKLLSAFKAGGRWIGDLFVELVSVWPLFIVILAGVLIYKKYKPKNVKQTA